MSEESATGQSTKNDGYDTKKNKNSADSKMHYDECSQKSLTYKKKSNTGEQH